MPFPGIPAGSELEKRIDRCVMRVMGTGRDKSRAIAICRSSIEGKASTKDRGDAMQQANYRDAGPASTQICGTCRFGGNGQCGLFDFTYDDNWTCDRWLPNIQATRDRLRVLQEENKGRMAQRRKMVADAIMRISLKKAETENQRRAMFAKMGSSGGGGGGGDTPLWAKGPDGKRTQAAGLQSDRLSKDNLTGAQLKLVEMGASKLGVSQEKIIRAAQLMETAYNRAGLEGDKSSHIGNALQMIQAGEAKAWLDSFSPDSQLVQQAGPEIKKVYGIKSSEKSSFTVFKDANDRYRWLMISSSAYQDRDGEIVSQQALKNAVKLHDQTGNRGPLRWWHLPIDIGDTDFGMIQGRMLIESGTFKNEGIGGAIAAQTENLSASIGFKHPKSEPIEKTFETINIFERSLLPREKASNYFAKLTVKEQVIMSDEKIKEFINLVGPEMAAKFLTEVATTDKGAEEAGFSYKAHDDLAAMSADELLEYSLLRKEHEEVEAAQTEPEPEPAQQEKQPANNDGIMSRLNQLAKAVQANAVAIKSIQEAVTQKEADNVTTELDQRLAALEAEQPRAIKEGYRASQQGEPVNDEKGKEATNEIDIALKEQLQRHPQAAPFIDVATAMANGLAHPYWGQAPAGNPQIPPQANT